MTYLLDQAVGLVPLILATVDRHAVLIQLERETKGASLDTPGLEAAGTELLREVIEYLDVVSNIRRIVLGNDWNVAKGLALDDLLGIGVRQFGRRPSAIRLSARRVRTSHGNVYLMMVLPNHFFTTVASLVIVKTTVNARRS